MTYLTLSAVAIGTGGLLLFSFMKQNEIQKNWCRGCDGTEELEKEYKVASVQVK